MKIANNSAGAYLVSMKILDKQQDFIRKRIFLMTFEQLAMRKGLLMERDKNSIEIVREMFCYTDVFTMSAKKDTIVNVGTLIGVQDSI